MIPVQVAEGHEINLTPGAHSKQTGVCGIEYPRYRSGPPLDRLYMLFLFRHSSRHAIEIHSYRLNNLFRLPIQGGWRDDPEGVSLRSAPIIQFPDTSAKYCRSRCLERLPALKADTGR